MNPVAAFFRCPAMVGALLTAACSIEPREIQVVDGAPGAGGQGGSVVRDASHEANGGRGGSGGVGGRSDASTAGNTGKDGSSGAGGTGGAAGGTGSGGAGTGGGTGSGGTAGAGASGGIGGAGGAAGGGGVGGLGAGGAAGLGGSGGAGVTGGSGGAAGNGAGGSTAGSSGVGGSGGVDSGTTGGTAGQTGKDASDVRIVDAPVGSNVVLFEETFPSGLGKFTRSNGCGSQPDWRNQDFGQGPYVHADAPGALGASSIASPTINIPGNVANIRLRMNHQVWTEAGHDGAQLLVSVNGAPPEIVKSFTNDGYVNNASVDADNDCEEGSYGQYPAWSGERPLEEQPEANLSSAPFEVGPGDTVSIHLRIVVNNSNASGGWDIEWVRLTGTVQ